MQRTANWVENMERSRFQTLFLQTCSKRKYFPAPAMFLGCIAVLSWCQTWITQPEWRTLSCNNLISTKSHISEDLLFILVYNLLVSLGKAGVFENRFLYAQLKPQNMNLHEIKKKKKKEEVDFIQSHHMCIKDFKVPLHLLFTVSGFFSIHEYQSFYLPFLVFPKWAAWIHIHIKTRKQRTFFHSIG